MSNSIKLFGTDEFVEPMRTLSAGPITCSFDQGALRFIKIYGKEAIRNIAIVIRDKDWGTYPAALSNLDIKQNSDSFSIAFDAICKDEQQEIQYSAKITGSSNGKLSFTGHFSATTDFLTNRTGFVVLHPLNGVAGHPVTVESVNGEIEQSEFPELIDPVQPIKNIRALTHEVLPGVSVCCRMTGEAFEMEDQRQWNDASYKTYVRPLDLPWPYTIPKAEKFEQSIELSIINSVEKSTQIQPKHDLQRCTISISKAKTPKPMPQIGLGLEPQHLAGALECQALLTRLAPQQMVLWYELDKHSVDHLKQATHLCNSINAKIELQAVIPDNDFKAEIAELAIRCRQEKINLSAIHVAPAMYLNSLMPGPSWPNVTKLATLYDEVRLQFPDIAIGGGMLSFFTEINRHRPPTAHIDFVSHASNTLTHAGDDITVTENLEALPYIIKTCRSFSPSTPYHVGPSSIAMRFNPYGAKTVDNPNNKRVAMSRMDPRQRGLLNAAWTTGYAAHMIRGDIDCINLHAPTGEFGIFNHQETWQRPGFDGSDKEVYPVYSVLAGLTAAAGKPQLCSHSSMSREVEVFGYEDNGKHVVWIANLTGDLRIIQIEGLGSINSTIATLSIDTFDQCTDTSDGFECTAVEHEGSEMTLSPYCVVRLTNRISE